MLKKIETWFVILIPLLSLLAGSGWLQFYIKHKQSEKLENRQYLEGFLLPFQATLIYNERVFKELTEDQTLKNLEYAPDYLQEYFSKLDDPRKIMWLQRINLLHHENSKAISLYEKNVGKITNPKLNKACLDFKYHAEKWKSVWDAIFSNQDIREIFSTNDLIAPKFPKDLDSLLEEEIKKVKESL